MRVFGFIAAFTAFTAVFASPLPAPATANSIAVRDGTVDVTALTVSPEIGSIISGVQTDIAPYISGIEATIEDSSLDLDQKIQKILPCLETVISILTTAGGKIALSAAGSWWSGLFGSSGSGAKLSLQDVGGLLKGIEQDIVDILCKVATLIGTADPGTAAVIQTVISVLNMIMQGVQEVAGDLTTILPDWSSLIAPLLGMLGIDLSAIPGPLK